MKKKNPVIQHHYGSKNLNVLTQAMKKALYAGFVSCMKPKKHVSLAMFMRQFKYEGRTVALYDYLFFKGAESQQSGFRDYPTSKFRKILDKRIACYRKHAHKNLSRLLDVSQKEASEFVSVMQSKWSGPWMFSISLAAQRQKHRFERNPIADKDIEDCLVALAILKAYPERTEDFKEHILDALESEGLWSYENGVTKKGLQFLYDCHADEE